MYYQRQLEDKVLGRDRSSSARRLARGDSLSGSGTCGGWAEAPGYLDVLPAVTPRKACGLMGVRKGSDLEEGMGEQVHRKPDAEGRLADVESQVAR